MIKRKKTNRIIRYIAVYRRKIRKLNRKKIIFWLKDNLKKHPLILGILFFIWINTIINKIFSSKINIIGLLKINFFILLAWFVLVVLSNLLKDKNKVKWYFKKRFVFCMLILFYPLGLVLLWVGSQFKRITKISLTVILGLIFIFYNVYNIRKYEVVINRPAPERIIEIIAQRKKKTYLPYFNKKVSIALATCKKEEKIKLPVSEIASRCLPGVVSIKTKDKENKDMGIGSGFVISEDGLIVTNFHVIESAYQAEIKIGDKIFKEVFLVKDLPEKDLAILKVNSEALSALPLGDSDELLSGQFIVVLGNPLGLERSVSTGIVSALRTKGEMKIIQMTAPISFGSSGGPVINEYGEVVGVTTLGSFFIAQNLNFAIPINYLKKMLEEKKEDVKDKIKEIDPKDF